MAKNTQKNTLIDGERNFAVQVSVDEDSTTGDLSNEVVVDVSALSPVPSSLVITRVHGSTNGGGAKLKFDRTTNQGAITLPADAEVDFDYRVKGANGFYDNGSGSTGDIVLDTNNIDAAGDSLSLYIEGRKRFS